MLFQVVIPVVMIAPSNGWEHPPTPFVGYRFFPTSVMGVGYIRKVPSDLDGGPISRRDNLPSLYYAHFPYPCILQSVYLHPYLMPVARENVDTVAPDFPEYIDI
jgi:hypothetical protein